MLLRLRLAACTARAIRVASPLWQYAKRHGAELRDSDRLRRAVEVQVLKRFIACGDPHHGFARIYCDACRHD